MSKVYVAEYPGVASVDANGSVLAFSQPPLAEYVLDSTATTGGVNVLGAITAGSLYTNGTYLNVPLTGGTGSGATANITVAGAAVTVVTIVNRGTGYTAADSLSAAAANIGGTGSGFAVAVTSITVLSPAAQASTVFYDISTDGICSISVNTQPVATVTNQRLAAGERRPVGIPVGRAFRISVITNT